MYEFKSYYEFEPTHVLKNDLYYAIKNEVGYYFEDAYLRKLDTLSETYDGYASQVVGKQAGVLSRVASYMSDIKVGTIGQYVSYFNRNFNKSIFSQSYIVETQDTMRCLMKIDTLINRLVIDMVIKLVDSLKEMGSDPYMVITTYFEGDHKKVYPDFEHFLLACEQVVNEII